MEPVLRIHAIGRASRPLYTPLIEPAVAEWCPRPAALPGWHPEAAEYPTESGSAPAQPALAQVTSAPNRPAAKSFENRHLF